VNRLALLALFVLPGCLHTGRFDRTWYVGAVAPPAPERVAACRSERAAHSDWVVAAGGFGLVGTSAASSAAALPDRDKAALNVLAAVSAALSGFAALFVSKTADEYASDDCQEVLSTP
jgi:hypothetical protein